MPNLDYSALEREPTREEVAAFKAERKSSVKAARSGVSLSASIPAVLGIAFFAVVIVLMATVFFTILSAGSGSDGPGFGSFLVPIVGIIALVAVISVVGSRGRWKRVLRQTRFAEANGMLFAEQTESPGYPGAIFHRGGSRQMVQHYRTTSGRFLDFGNYRFVTGSGKNRRTHTWGYLALRLDRPLPHMLLDARGNNSLFGSNLPVSFDRDQVLSLEGDFDRHFTLYCPREYERDALYILTPDLMALLIDNAATMDLEIVDDWLFVYSSSAFTMDRPADIRRLMAVVDTVGEKTLDRTERYRDDRALLAEPAGGRREPEMPDRPAVAPGGRRLKKGVAWPAVITVGVGIIAVFAWEILTR